MRVVHQWLRGSDTTGNVFGHQARIVEEDGRYRAECIPNGMAWEPIRYWMEADTREFVRVLDMERMRQEVQLSYL